MQFKTKNIEKLHTLESIRHERISDLDIKFLENYASFNKIPEFDYPKSPADFSRQRSFFVANKSNIKFLKDGKEVCYEMVDHSAMPFIAFRTELGKLFIYGYFPSERD